MEEWFLSVLGFLSKFKICLASFLKLKAFEGFVQCVFLCLLPRQKPINLYCTRSTYPRCHFFFKSLVVLLDFQISFWSLKVWTSPWLWQPASHCSVSCLCSSTPGAFPVPCWWISPCPPAMWAAISCGSLLDVFMTRLGEQSQREYP